MRALLPVVLGLLVACAPPRDEDPSAVALALESRDEEQLEESLEGIENWLSANFPEAAARLRPGLSNDEIDAKLAAASFPYALPAEVRQLYRWHDGMDRADDLPFIWYHRFLSLDEALKRTRAPFMPANALTIFGFPEEHYYVLCTATPCEALPIRHRLLEDPAERVAFTSLGTMMRTGYEWYLQGAVQADGSGWLTEDIYAVADIHSDWNPGSVFPFAVP